LNFAPFVLTIEEGTLVGGFRSAVLEFASKKRFDTRKIYSLGIPDEFIEHGSRTELLELLGLTSSGITTKVKEILGRGGKNDR
jgi:1-deoxy-D-xylulose-5-phosphate synthase